MDADTSYMIDVQFTYLFIIKSIYHVQKSCHMPWVKIEEDPTLLKDNEMGKNVDLKTLRYTLSNIQ